MGRADESSAPMIAPDRLVRVPCLICASERDETVTFFNGFRIARCAECGFVFVNPRPTETDLAGLYADSRSNPYAGEAYEPFELERPVLEKIIRFIVRRAGTGSLFEVGCGRGDLLRVARAHGFSVGGCDHYGGRMPDLEGTNLHDGSLSSARLPDGATDVVVIRNTLEHLFDPRRELGEIWRVLRPRGTVYLKVPNFRFEYGLGCRIVLGKPHALEAPYHLNHFTPVSLKALLKDSRFGFVDWHIEQPTVDPRPGKNLTRQAGYLAMRVMRTSTGGFLFPKVLLSCLARKLDGEPDPRTAPVSRRGDGSRPAGRESGR